MDHVGKLRARTAIALDLLKPGEAELNSGALAKHERVWLEAEVDRLIAEADGDARLALALCGMDDGLYASVPREVRAAAGASRVPTGLRRLDEHQYAGFKLLAEGGMGSVYTATDTQLHRDVAFKMVRTESAGPLDRTHTPIPATQVSRFLHEAWVTGGLEHPGIVPVHEVGLTFSGVPYYTMRLIRGERTLEDAIQEAGSAEARLALLEPFLRICDAVRYAHSQGVIHRDLKPVNIALGPFGEAFALDWGLARVRGEPDKVYGRLQSRLIELRKEADLKTLTSAVGTPGYMAPESALGEFDQVDARSDVYSLGAILHRILTGRPLFTFETFIEYVGKACAGIKSVSGAPKGLARICCRATAPEREDRYANADELADAIRNWQAENVVDREVRTLLDEAEASLEGAEATEGEALLRRIDRAVAQGTRVCKLRQGHVEATRLLDRARTLRTDAIAAGERGARKRLLHSVGVVGLVVATAVALLVALLLEGRRQEAEAARSRAENERGKAQGLASFILYDLRKGLEPLHRLDLLGPAAEQALAYYESVPIAEDDGSAMRDRATALGYVSEILAAKGKRKLAFATQERAVAYHRVLVARYPANRSLALGLAASLEKQGAIAFYLGNLELVQRILREELSIIRKLVADDRQNPRWQSALTHALYHIGTTARHAAKFDESLAWHKEALEISRRLLESDPKNHDHLKGVAVSLLSLGDTVSDMGELDQARAYMHEALDLHKRLATEDPKNGERWFDVALAHSRVGDIAQLQEDHATARASNQAAWEIFARIAARDPMNLRWAREVGRSAGGVGQAQRDLGDHVASLRDLKESLVLFQRLAKQDPDNPESVHDLALALVQVGRGLQFLGRCKEAVPLHRDAAQTFGRYVVLEPGAEEEHVLAEETLRCALLLAGEAQPADAGDHYLLANRLHELGKYSEAVLSYERTMADPKIREDLERYVLYYAACAAALTEGPDTADDRAQGLKWLAEDVKLRRGVVSRAEAAFAGGLVTDETLKRLRSEFEDHMNWVRETETDFASLRKLPGFAKILGD